MTLEIATCIKDMTKLTEMINTPYDPLGQEFFMLQCKNAQQWKAIKS